MARLATLQVRERVAQAKAKPKVKAKAESSASFCGRIEHGEDGVADHGGVAELHGSSAKKQRTLKQMFLSSGSGRVGASMFKQLLQSTVQMNMMSLALHTTTQVIV